MRTHSLLRFIRQTTRAALCLVAAFSFVACSSSPATPPADALLPPLPPTGGPVLAEAGLVTEANRAAVVPPGDASKGLPGDYYLRNDKVRVLIQAPGRFGEPLGYGGNPINLALVSEDGAPGQTLFGELSAFLNGGHTARMTRIEVLRDGKAGGPAVVRAHGEIAVLDYFNITSFIDGLGLDRYNPNVPPPARIVATYTATPGEAWIRLQYTLLNDSAADLPLAIGTYLDTGGDLELFMPGPGFGGLAVSDVSSLLGNAIPADYIVSVGRERAYGVYPTLDGSPAPIPNAPIFVAGQAVVLHDTVSILEGLTQSKFVVPAKKSKTFVLHLVAGRDAGDVHAATLRIRGKQTGTLEGRVVQQGTATPIGGARVAVLDNNGGVVTSYTSRADGRFGGALEAGDYTLVADKQGWPRSSERALTVTAGQTASAELPLPQTARLPFRVVDGADRPLAVKLTFVGTDPSPPDARFTNPRGDFAGTGVTRTVHALRGDSDSDGVIEIEPGTYRVVVSHGNEYTLFDALRTVAAGDNPRLEAKLVRVVESTGYVKGDFHQHGVNSPDAPTPMRERVITYLAAGMEYIGSSDHEYLTDYTPTIAALGASDQLGSMVGVESTPFDYGHFNAFPMTIDPSAPNKGAPDWGNGELSNLSPGRLFQKMRAGGAEVVQINHARVANARTTPAAGFQAYFDRVALSYDLDNGTFGGDPELQPVPNEILRIAADEPLWTPDFDSLEIYNNFEVRTDTESGEPFEQKVDLLRRDWFNLLSMGKVVTAMGNTDSHTRNSEPTEAPFTYIRVPDDSRPGAVRARDVLDTLKNTHDTIVSNGPFLTLHLGGDTQPSVGRVTRATTNSVGLTVRVQAPVWMHVDEVRIYANNTYRIPQSGPNPDRMNPRLVVRLSETPGAGEVQLRRVTVAPGAERFEATVELPAFELPHREKDAWIVAEVRGTRGMYPYLANEVPATAPLADLVSGAYRGGVFPLAFTGPAFVDRDGNGRYDAFLKR